MGHPTLELTGLSDLDTEELLVAMGDHVDLRRPEVPEGTLAEPATVVAIITIGSPIVLNALAIWLATPRRRASAGSLRTA